MLKEMLEFLRETNVESLEFRDDEEEKTLFLVADNEEFPISYDLINNREDESIKYMKEFINEKIKK